MQFNSLSEPDIKFTVKLGSVYQHLKFEIQFYFYEEVSISVTWFQYLEGLIVFNPRRNEFDHVIWLPVY